MRDRWAREKKKLRKKEERREAGEREREGNVFFNQRRERRAINIYIYIYIFFFLPLSYSTHLKIDVHCSWGAKSFRFSSTAAWWFFVIES